MLKYKLSCLLLLNLFLHAEKGDYQFFGFFHATDRLFLINFFLPFDPTIVVVGDAEDVKVRCQEAWPEALLFSDDFFIQNRYCKYDLVWLESNEELKILQNASDLLKQTPIIYTKTQESSFEELHSFLDKCDFALLAHWYFEELQGDAIFIKKELLYAIIRSLNYSALPSNNSSSHESSFDISSFFRLPENKTPWHSIDQIDFIYMINLDERPLKFFHTAQKLYPFDIYPYRFPAVNGWQLSASALSDIGVRFYPGMLSEKFMGSLYHEIEGSLCVSNGLIQENGSAYFTLGMSRGSIGTVLSHLSVLQDAYNSGHTTIWVMEDDIEVEDDPRKISEYIRKLDALTSDWDILFTDIDTKDPKGNPVPCLALAGRPNFDIPLLSTFLQKFYPLSTDFDRIGMRYGAYSMIIRRSGIEKILNYFKTYGIFLPYDLDYWLTPDLKMYRVTKDIVSHAHGVGTCSDNSRPGY